MRQFCALLLPLTSIYFIRKHGFRQVSAFLAPLVAKLGMMFWVGPCIVYTIQLA